MITGDVGTQYSDPFPHDLGNTPTVDDTGGVELSQKTVTSFQKKKKS